MRGYSKIKLKRNTENEKKVHSGQIESRLVENNEIYKKDEIFFPKIEMLWFRR
jgi:hypothetical protein